MIRGMLDLRQVQKCTYDIKVEHRLMIFTAFAELRRDRHMRCHRVDSGLDMLVAVHTLRHSTRLTRWL